MFTEFDLQLFAEGAGTTTTDPGTAGADEGAEKVVLVDGQVKLVRGDKLVSDLADEDPEDDDPAGEEAGQEGGEGKADPDAGNDTPAGEQVYSPEEVRTTDFDKLDPKRLPPEMQEWYRAMQVPITR
jgi:hypothetical protein